MSNKPEVVDGDLENDTDAEVVVDEIEDTIPSDLSSDNDSNEVDNSDDEEVGGPAEYAASEGGRTGRGGGNLRADDIDYKNVTQLSRFLDRRGRILSRRKTRVNAKTQRKIAIAVKRARHLALLPYTADQTRIVRKRR